MNDGAAGRAALLGVVVGEHHAFPGDAVDVRRAVAHHADRVGADVGLADVVAEDDEDVRLARPSRRRRRGLLRLRELVAAADQHRARRPGPLLPSSRLRRSSRAARANCRLSLISDHLLSSLDDAAEADMAGRGVDRLGVARGRAIAAAIVRRAQMRAALQHLARNADLAAGAGS